jgi:hypothetical protein
MREKMKALPQIVGGERLKRFIRLELSSGDKPEFTDIRAGLVFPTAEHPACAIFLGMEWVDPRVYQVNESARKLYLLAEVIYTEFGVDRLFHKLSDLASACCCTDIFCDLDHEKHADFLDAARAYEDRHKSYAELIAAPFVDNPWLGVSLVHDWARSGKLKIPEDAEAYTQLKKVSKADLDNLDGFYAINALRLVIGSFHMDPPRVVRPYRYQPPRSATGPFGWMAG